MGSELKEVFLEGLREEGMVCEERNESRKDLREVY